MEDSAEEKVTIDTDKSNSLASESNNPVVASAELDPYAYTKTDAFTSEIFKVEIFNLPKFFGVKVINGIPTICFGI
jgi:hypothetical protein